MYFTSCYPLQRENEKNKPKFNAMIDKVFFLSLAVLSRCFEHCARVILAPKKPQREVVPSLACRRFMNQARRRRHFARNATRACRNFWERVKGLSELYDCKI